jgi:hypothetical protein
MPIVKIIQGEFNIDLNIVVEDEKKVGMAKCRPLCNSLFR